MRSLLFPPGSWCAQDFVCALQEWSFCFHQSCGNPAIKSCWLQSQILWGLFFPLPDPQAGKPDMGCRTFTPVGELLWYNYFLFCVSSTWWVGDLILSWLCPCSHLIVTSPLSLDVKCFFGRFQHFFFFFDHCSVFSGVSGVLIRRGECMSFYSAIFSIINKDRSWGCYAKWDKSDGERQLPQHSTRVKYKNINEQTNK